MPRDFPWVLSRDTREAVDGDADPDQPVIPAKLGPALAAGHLPDALPGDAQPFGRLVQGQPHTILIHDRFTTAPGLVLGLILRRPQARPGMSLGLEWLTGCIRPLPRGATHCHLSCLAGGGWARGGPN